MPLDISSNAIIEKNKLTSMNVELLLLEVKYKSEPSIYVCLNNTEIYWNFNTYLPAIFNLTGRDETKEAEIPKVTLSFTDINRVIIPLLEQFKGAHGAVVTISIVDSKYLNDITPKLQETLEIIDTTVNDKAEVVISLGAENLFNLRIPRNRYLKNNCRFDFKGTLCGYSGSETNCNGTYARCKELGNQTRFGNFPSVGKKGFFS